MVFYSKLQCHKKKKKALGAQKLGFESITDNWGLSGDAVVSCFSYIWLFAILWTVALQVPLFMGFSRQEYRSHSKNGDSIEMEYKSIQNNIFKCPSLEYKGMENFSQIFPTKIQN